jgi:cytochrome P450
MNQLGDARRTPSSLGVGSNLIGHASASPAGPIDFDEAAQLPAPPTVMQPVMLQKLRFNQRQAGFVFLARRELGDVFRTRGTLPGPRSTITSHPDHVRSLFTATPEQAPTLADSPMLPVVGPNSVLTATGPRHMHQRKLLLPPFHGAAIERFAEIIRDGIEREIDGWPVGRPFPLAPRMQALTLDVILAGVMGLAGKPARGTPDYWFRQAVRGIVAASTWPVAQVSEVSNADRKEAVGFIRFCLDLLDRPTYAVIRRRRRDERLSERRDILSLLLRARTEEGEMMSDKEVRDELLTLVLAGHQTTAHSIAWTWERLVHNLPAHEALVDGVRSAGGASEMIEATIIEAMRCRPVIPIIGRRPTVPWRLGPYAVPPQTPLGISILLVHHREDLYPEPFAFLPGRWLDRRPGAYEWLPFGGSTRRCLGAALAMTEQRIVLEVMARRLDLDADDRRPERAIHRNVTMIPARGARVIIRSKRA